MATPRNASGALSRTPSRPGSASPSAKNSLSFTVPNVSKGGTAAIPPATPLPSSGSTRVKNASGGGPAGKGAPSGRVRVAVRVRPKTEAEKIADVDFADAVEMLPELNRVKLCKNNWESEAYQFDTVLVESSSQKRVYETVAKPVVESVLEGYNGTIMAYGQTGTGKTFTLGSLGQNDPSLRGIMARAMEDLTESINKATDTISINYLQLYNETIGDLLAPDQKDLAIEENKGEVSVPQATTVDVHDTAGFIRLLQQGESNRAAANTKMNTESSRSHAILVVTVKKSFTPEDGSMPVIRRGKLLIVDLAGSERIAKSGVEGVAAEEAKFINLSLTALGKCINALAESSPHVPTRDSKLTRILKDSFGGSARTSMIITISPSQLNRSETASTIQFGQRAMKVENMLKVKEEFDYKGLAKKLQVDLDACTAEVERREKAVSERERALGEKQAEARKLATEAAELQEKLKREVVAAKAEAEAVKQEALKAQQEATSSQEGVALLQKRHADEVRELKQTAAERQAALEKEVEAAKAEIEQLKEALKKKEAETPSRRSSWEELYGKGSRMTTPRTPSTKGFEHVGLEKLLHLLASDDLDIKIHSVKMLANLAAEESNQEKIVQAGGLQSLLQLLETTKDENCRRVAAGAVANLAMNETNQELIMAQSGVKLLVGVSETAQDAQTLRMVAGAIANLCGNDKVQKRLQEEGGLRALLKMAETGHVEVLAQVARGFANFAKCDRAGHSLLIEEKALGWLVEHADAPAASVKRHVELALCHMAQHEVNAADIVKGGALAQLVRISKECMREDVRDLAARVLAGSPAFQKELAAEKTLGHR